MTDTEILLFEFDVEPPHEGETYEIQRSPNGIDFWETVGFTNDQYFEGTDVPIRSTHWLRVRQFENGVWSLYSEPVEVTTNYVYDVRESLTGTNDWTVIAEGVEGFDYTATEREPDTAYDVSVRASNGFSVSGWSEPIEVVTEGEAVNLDWVAPPEHSVLSGVVSLVTQTMGGQVARVRYRIGDVVLGETDND